MVKRGRDRGRGGSTILSWGLKNSGFSAPPKEFFDPPFVRYVLVHLRLTTWRHLDFEVKLHENSSLSVVEQKIIEHHGGSIHALEMWKDQVFSANKLTDRSLTLKQAFQFKEPEKVPEQENSDSPHTDGESQDVTPEVRSSKSSASKQGVQNYRAPPNKDYYWECTIYYDYKPFHSNCSLLLCSPRTLAPGSEV